MNVVEVDVVVEDGVKEVWVLLLLLKKNVKKSSVNVFVVVLGVIGNMCVVSVVKYDKFFVFDFNGLFIDC